MLKTMSVNKNDKREVNNTRQHVDASTVRGVLVKMAHLWHRGDEVNGLQTRDRLPPLVNVLYNCEEKQDSSHLVFLGQDCT